MGEQDRMDPDGVPNDGVSHEPAASRLHFYADARQQLQTFQEPVLLRAGNPHERLFLAAFDGTGNDKTHDRGHETNVGLISDQIEALNSDGNARVVSGYVPGAGTQRDRPMARLLDGATGSSVEERAEQMYKQFIDQAKRWQREDAQIQIRVASVSFSRGGETDAIFARLVEERGIQDPAGASYTYDSHRQITHVQYTKPPLVPPHQVAQAVALLDPVGTGHAMHVDRRLPPSVISGIQLVALDEHRGLFKSDRLIDPGMTPDGRFAAVYVPGSHSDVGGGFNRNGLSNRSGNLVIDYLNGLSDRPFLAKLPETDDPRFNVVHHSTDGMLLYRVAPRVDRLQRGGYNELLVNWGERHNVSDAYNAEPRNETLSRQFERQTMPNGPLPAAPDQQQRPENELEQWIDRMYQVSQQPDNGAWDQARNRVAQSFLCSPGGQQFQQQADAQNCAWDLQWQAQQQALQPVAQQAVQQAAQQGAQGFCQ